MKEILNLSLNIKPTSYSTDKDEEIREQVRSEIRKQIPEFNEQYISKTITFCKEIEMTINCYLQPQINEPDIDNLAKVPIDAVFFSGRNEIGDKEGWETKINKLTVRKIKSNNNKLEIIMNVI